MITLENPQPQASIHPSRSGDSLDFLLTRHSRSVIQDGPMRDHLLHLEKPNSVCPVRELMFRRAGIKLEPGWRLL